MPIALIDSNNFYAACEQSIDPSTISRPLVVLSNNDGCIIARNAEAKALGIPMGQPYFQVNHSLEKLGVMIRSSNYELYADMSQRLMSLIGDNCEEIEIYSIDEAFVQISRPRNNSLIPWASRLREITYQRLGLVVSIGIGQTKGQSKIANHLAKATTSYAGIFDLASDENQSNWLEQIAIENVWGIGRKLSCWCRIQGIQNARQFRDAPSNKIKRKLGIKGVRLQYELKGKKCLNLSIKPTQKKETCVSRSLSHPISNIRELREVIATHVVRACEKLRKQQQCATAVTIFTRTSLYTPPFYSQSATEHLAIPSNNTTVLLSATSNLTAKIFHPNHLLVKVGVIMQGLIPANNIQLHLLSGESNKEVNKKESLIKTIDSLNQRYGRNTVSWASCGINQKWGMSRQYLSPAATTRIEDIPIVIA